MDHRSLVFASVFPVPSLSHTTPTPIATPDLGHASFGQSFGGHGASSAAFASNATGGQHQQQRAIRRNLAWSTATRFLSLPRTDTGVEQLAQSKWALRTQEVEEALEYLLVGEGQSEDGNEQGLVEWYTNEATLHFASVVRPVLMGLWEKVWRRRTRWKWSLTDRKVGDSKRSCMGDAGRGMSHPRASSELLFPAV